MRTFRERERERVMEGERGRWSLYKKREVAEMVVVAGGIGGSWTTANVAVERFVIIIRGVAVRFLAE